MRVRGVVQVGLAAPDAENVGSGLGEGDRGRTPDPGTCAGDNHCPVVEVMCCRADISPNR